MTSTGGPVTYRSDLYYVNTRWRSRTLRCYHRERVVPWWKWYLYYRWQVWRFEKMKNFHVLREREDYPAERTTDDDPPRVPHLGVQ
jgi:hypothetical protein